MNWSPSVGSSPAPTLGRSPALLARGSCGVRLHPSGDRFDLGDDRLTGLTDLAWLSQRAPEFPGLFFDTSWWSATDLLTRS